MSEIFVVDDDPSVLAVLSIILRGAGFEVTSFVEGDTFLAAARSRAPECILLDVYLPNCSGLELLRRLDAQRYPAPILIISGSGDIPTAVDAIRNGALDFIEKPFDGAALVTRVREAISAWQNRNRKDVPPTQSFPGHDRLTAREREVLKQIAQGASNKEASRELGISPRTIEVHRARIMEKLAAKNVADLMRIVLSGGSGHGTGHGPAALSWQ